MKITTLTALAGVVLSLDAAVSAQTPGTLKWRYHCGGTSSAAISPSDGTIYIGSSDDNLYALNPNGTLKWSYTTGGSISLASPSIAVDGTIYIGSDDGKLYAINPDGTLKWTYQTHLLFGTTPQAINGSCAIGTDGTIYFGAGDFFMHALNPDGTEKWEYAANAAFFTAPAIGFDGTIYFAQEGEDLYAMNPNGSLKWVYGALTSFSSPAIGADGTIYLGQDAGTSGGGLAAYNSDGTQQWFTSGIDNIESSPAVGPNGTIYAGHESGGLATYTASGSLTWYFDTGYIFSSSPALAADGTSYIGDYAGLISAATSSGTTAWTYSTGAAIHGSPTIGSDGTVYVESTDGYFYAIYGSSGPAKFAWSMLQGDPTHKANANFTYPLETLIDVDFGAGATQSSEVGFAATGQSTNDFWNFYTRDDGSGGYLSFGSLAPLKFVDQTVSGVGLTISNAPGAWGNGTSDPMYAGYLYPFDEGDIAVTLTNLNPGLYNFYIYGHGNEDDQDSLFDVAVGTNDYGSATTTDTSAWNSVDWQEGNQYVLLGGVPVTNTNQVVTMTVSPNSSSYAILAGMQIERSTNPIIDVDFAGSNGSTNSQEVGLAATGLTTNDFWNLYSAPGSTSSSLSPLYYSDQTISGASLTVNNAPGQWGNGAADFMYTGYIYPWDDGDITVTVTNLAPGAYNIYMYGHGNEDDQDSLFDVAVGAFDYGSATTTSTPSWASANWQEGIQYVVARNVGIGPTDVLTVTISPNSSYIAVLAGMQIVRIQ